MPRQRFSSSTELSAPAGYVYALLADYRNAHQRILPARYVRGFAVERGGVGAGTVVRFAMRLAGRSRWIRAVVTEPEPGRVLLERDVDTGALTTFTVEPLATGGCAVTIATDLTIRRGLRGRVERLVAWVLLRRVYDAELAQLRTVASAPACDDGWSLPLAGLRAATAPSRRHAMQPV